MGKRRRRLFGRLIALLIPLAAGLLVADFFRFMHSPLRAGEPARHVYTIEPGTAVRTVAASLAERGLLDRPLYFRIAARLTGDARRIRAGEYVIDTGTTPWRLLDKFVSGNVKEYRLTIIEGWTVAEMMSAIESHDAIEHTLETGAGSGDGQAIMKALGHPDQHAEGRFFPDTYQFPRGVSDVELLERAYRRMERVLREEWSGRTEDLPLETPYEALTLASIVERETGAPDERARIAGVFVERLQRGMRLQTDPTVIYGLGEEFDGNLVRSDLRADTPYNTYTRAGLPPTPIALPSRAAIHAALHPERRGELYFVSTGDGRHVFSKTLEEHNAAVQKYQLGGGSR